MYAIYLRKSRADIELEKDGEFETLKAHESILTEFAKKNHLPIAKVYKEIVSGETIDDRPEMKNLLDDVADGLYDGVIVVEIERLARGNGFDQSIILETFKSANTSIITPSKTYNPNDPNDEQFFELGLMLSRLEYHTIRRRMDRGRIQSYKNGTCCFPTPFGYSQTGSGRKRTFIKNQDSETVVRIYEEFNSGKGYAEIANMLNDEGVLHYENLWTREAIKNILKNESYLGIIATGHRQRKKEYDPKTKSYKKVTHRSSDLTVHKQDAFTPIIEKELFDSVQKRISERKTKSTPTKYKLVNPLAGLVVCPKCGYSYYLNGQKGYLLHPKYYKKKCDVVSISTAVSYDEVITRLIAELKSKVGDLEIELNDGSDEKELKAQKERKRISKQIEKKKQLETKLYDFLETGVYSTEEFVERRTKLKLDIEELQKKLDSIETVKKSDLQNRIISMNIVLDSLKSDQIPAQDKNELLSCIIERIEVEPTPSKNKCRKSKTFNMLVVYK